MTDLPRYCEQPGCARAMETWCPLCEHFYCLRHDALFPVRRHDCLTGPAEEDAA